MCFPGQVDDGELRRVVDLQGGPTVVHPRSADKEMVRVDCCVSRPETEMYEAGSMGWEEESC